MDRGWGNLPHKPQPFSSALTAIAFFFIKKQAWVWLTHYTRQESLNLKTSNMPKDPWSWRANLSFSNKRFGTIFLPIKISHTYSKFQICKGILIMVLVLHFCIGICISMDNGYGNELPFKIIFDPLQIIYSILVKIFRITKYSMLLKIKINKQHITQFMTPICNWVQGACSSPVIKSSYSYIWGHVFESIFPQYCSFF